MTAPPVTTIAWRASKGFTRTRHLIYERDPSYTLCMRRVPTNTRVDRGCTKGALCRGCVVVLDKSTAQRLTLETQTEARRTFEALRLERDER